jgi:hypothetical protein
MGMVSILLVSSSPRKKILGIIKTSWLADQGLLAKQVWQSGQYPRSI